MPEKIGKRTYEANKALYDQLEAEHPQGERVGVGASVLLISGCQDNQVSLDGPDNGLFTGMLLKVWNKGKFKGGIQKFHKSILQEIKFWQSPNYFKVGKSNSAFERQRPFTI